MMSKGWSCPPSVLWAGLRNEDMAPQRHMIAESIKVKAIKGKVM